MSEEGLIPIAEETSLEGKLAAIKQYIKKLNLDKEFELILEKAREESVYDLTIDFFFDRLLSADFNYYVLAMYNYATENNLGVAVLYATFAYQGVTTLSNIDNEQRKNAEYLHGFNMPVLEFDLSHGYSSLKFELEALMIVGNLEKEIALLKTQKTYPQTGKPFPPIAPTALGLYTLTQMDEKGLINIFDRYVFFKGIPEIIEKGWTKEKLSAVMNFHNRIMQLYRTIFKDKLTDTHFLIKPFFHWYGTPTLCRMCRLLEFDPSRVHADIYMQNMHFLYLEGLGRLIASRLLKDNFSPPGMNGELFKKSLQALEYGSYGCDFELPQHLFRHLCKSAGDMFATDDIYTINNAHYMLSAGISYILAEELLPSLLSISREDSQRLWLQEALRYQQYLYENKIMSKKEPHAIFFNVALCKKLSELARRHKKRAWERKSKRLTKNWIKLLKQSLAYFDFEQLLEDTVVELNRYFDNVTGSVLLSERPVSFSSLTPDSFAEMICKTIPIIDKKCVVITGIPVELHHAILEAVSRKTSYADEDTLMTFQELLSYRAESRELYDAYWKNKRLLLSNFQYGSDDKSVYSQENTMFTLAILTDWSKIHKSINNPVILCDNEFDMSRFNRDHIRQFSFALLRWPVFMHWTGSRFAVYYPRTSVEIPLIFEQHPSRPSEHVVQPTEAREVRTSP